MITLLCLLMSVSLAAAPSPSNEIIARMMLIEQSQNGDFNRSSGINYHGQCRRFQVDTFLEAAEDFVLADHPGVSLYLPSDHADEEIVGRPTGSCWDMPDPSTGNAFVEAARFDYDPELTSRENLQIAREFLTQVQAGDLVQILGVYGNGSRGTHTFMITRTYDARTQTLYWSDSNLSNKKVDGIRYGYVKAYQAKPLEEVAQWIGTAGNTGATIYRLNPSIVPAQ